MWKGRGVAFWKGYQLSAQRIAWILKYGDPPDGSLGYVRQECGKSLCVRPTHLYIGNPIDHRTPDDFWKLLKHVTNKRLGSDCWLWTQGHINAGVSSVTLEDGYGVFKYQSKQWLTHRLAWTIENGPIPKRKKVLHHCDTPACCNPKHLFLGSDADNRKDMVTKGRARYTFGEQHALSKLTDSLVREIRSKYTGKWGQISSLAREYNISIGTMYSVVTKQTWKHVV